VCHGPPEKAQHPPDWASYLNSLGLNSPTYNGVNKRLLPLINIGWERPDLISAWNKQKTNTQNNCFQDIVIRQQRTGVQRQVNWKNLMAVPAYCLQRGSRSQRPRNAHTLIWELEKPGKLSEQSRGERTPSTCRGLWSSLLRTLISLCRWGREQCPLLKQARNIACSHQDCQAEYAKETHSEVQEVFNHPTTNKIKFAVSGSQSKISRQINKQERMHKSPNQTSRTDRYIYD
jgi:hypothetical protein